jgi:hypothetical protein
VYMVCVLSFSLVLHSLVVSVAKGLSSSDSNGGFLIAIVPDHN